MGQFTQNLELLERNQDIHGKKKDKEPVEGEGMKMLLLS